MSSSFSRDWAPNVGQPIPESVPSAPPPPSGSYEPAEPAYRLRSPDPEQFALSMTLQRKAYDNDNKLALPEGWTVAATFGKPDEMAGYGQRQKTTSGLTGMVFVNQDRNQIAISFQGANTTGFDVDDIISAITHQGLDQLDDAKNKVQATLSDIDFKSILANGGQIYLTGHSNGHAPAEALSFMIGQDLLDDKSLTDDEKASLLSRINMVGIGGLGIRGDVLAEGLRGFDGKPINLNDPLFNAMDLNHFYTEKDFASYFFNGHNRRISGDVWTLPSDPISPWPVDTVEDHMFPAYKDADIDGAQFHGSWTAYGQRQLGPNGELIDPPAPAPGFYGQDPMGQQPQMRPAIPGTPDGQPLQLVPQPGQQGPAGPMGPVGPMGPGAALGQPPEPGWPQAGLQASNVAYRPHPTMQQASYRPALPSGYGGGGYGGGGYDGYGGFGGSPHDRRAAPPPAAGPLPAPGQMGPGGPYGHRVPNPARAHQPTASHNPFAPQPTPQSMPMGPDPLWDPDPLGRPSWNSVSLSWVPDDFAYKNLSPYGQELILHSRLQRLLNQGQPKQPKSFLARMMEGLNQPNEPRQDQTTLSSHVSGLPDPSLLRPMDSLPSPGWDMETLNLFLTPPTTMELGAPPKLSFVAR
ncbi:MAG: hypothetical protein ACPGOY_10665 [Rhodospirillaceae bacterium]